MTFFIYFSSRQDVLQVFLQDGQKFEIVGLLLLEQFHLVFIENDFMVRIDSKHVFLMNFELFVNFDFDVLEDFQDAFVLMDELIVGCIFGGNGFFELLGESFDFAEVGHFGGCKIDS